VTGSLTGFVGPKKLAKYDYDYTAKLALARGNKKIVPKKKIPEFLEVFCHM
jgi:hypothetical protein